MIDWKIFANVLVSLLLLLIECGLDRGEGMQFEARGGDAAGEGAIKSLFGFMA